MLNSRKIKSRGNYIISAAKKDVTMLNNNAWVDVKTDFKKTSCQLNSHSSRLCPTVRSLKHGKKKFSIRKRYRICNWLKGIYLRRDDTVPYSYLCATKIGCQIFSTPYTRTGTRHKAVIIIHTIHKFPISMSGFPMLSIHHNYLHQIY
jgi:hypothetical protein